MLNFPTLMSAHPVARLLLAAVVTACVLEPVRAQQLPFRSYGVAEGLAHARVLCVFQDSRGYYWFGTFDGLTRYDGLRSRTYVPGAERMSIVSSVSEDPWGRLWVGTLGGLARLADDPTVRAADGPAFVLVPVADVPPEHGVSAVTIDADGNLWCIADAGLYRARLAPEGEPVFERVASFRAPSGEISAIAIDRRGRAWATNGRELILTDGLTVAWCTPTADGAGDPVGVAFADGGRLVVATRRALFAAEEPAEVAAPAWIRLPARYPEGAVALAVACRPGGPIFVGLTAGLCRVEGDRSEIIGAAQGLSESPAISMLVDREGALWVGTDAAGAVRLADFTTVSYTRTEGLPGEIVDCVLEGADGRIYAGVQWNGLFEIARGRAVRVPGSDRPRFARINRRIARDGRGNWWVGTDAGAYFVAGPGLDLRRARPAPSEDGVLSSAGIFMVVEDATGAVWISTRDRGTYVSDGGRLPRRVPLGDPSLDPGFVYTVARRPGGPAWLGWLSTLARFEGEQVERIPVGCGLPELYVRSALVDRRGGLWLGLRFRGVAWAADASAVRPAFRNLTTADGLSSNTVWALEEDGDGRIYFGTSRGVDRYDPATGQFSPVALPARHRGSAVTGLLADRSGFVWAAAGADLVRLGIAAAGPAWRPAATLIERVEISGRDLPLRETGVPRLEGLTLGPDETLLRVEFVAPTSGDVAPVRYQFKLEGADGDWGEPTEQRSVTYPRLAPGSYTFLVRAAVPGEPPGAPASISFTVLPPVWMRWWFVLLAGSAAAGLLLAAHRYRVRQLLALERVRRQIAIDLHDDIGSGLSQVAILSEVARRDPAGLAGHLGRVEGLARSMRESMADIVWAIDPRRDSLSDLLQRMRQVAFNTAEAEGMESTGTCPATRRPPELDSPPTCAGTSC